MSDVAASAADEVHRAWRGPRDRAGAPLAACADCGRPAVLTRTGWTHRDCLPGGIWPHRACPPSGLGDDDRREP